MEVEALKTKSIDLNDTTADDIQSLDDDNSDIPAIIKNHKAQGLIAVLEDVVDQLSVLDDIVPENDKSDQQTRLLANEINRIVKQRDELAERYQNIVKEQSHLKSMSNKTQYKENQIMINNISIEYAQSTHVLARALKSHPSIAQNLKKIQQERNSIKNLISKTAKELKEGTFECLIKQTDAEYEKRDDLQMTIKREKKSSELLKHLQAELIYEKKVFEEELNERNVVIQQLKDTIQEINILTTSEQKYIKKEMKAHELSIKQRYVQKEAQLLDQKFLLQKKIELEEKAHAKIVEFLGKHRDGLEKQIQEWMTKYEEDLEKKTNELESLKTQRAQDLEKFEALVNQYEETEKFVEEYKQTKKKEEEIRLLLERQTHAAISIQVWYRRLKKKLNDKKNKGKKKSAKGKKKK